MSGPKEFDCAECGRHIVDCSGTNTSNLCAHCTFMPQWFADPTLRSTLDPSHNGVESMDKQQPRALAALGQSGGYFVWRGYPPYRHVPRAHDNPDQCAPYQAALIYRGNKLIGVQTEHRNTCRRNWRCWLFRRWRDWQRGVAPAAMHGGLDL